MKTKLCRINHPRASSQTVAASLQLRAEDVLQPGSLPWSDRHPVVDWPLYHHFFVLAEHELGVDETDEGWTVETRRRIATPTGWHRESAFLYQLRVRKSARTITYELKCPGLRNQPCGRWMPVMYLPAGDFVFACAKCHSLGKGKPFAPVDPDPFWGMGFDDVDENVDYHRWQAEADHPDDIAHVFSELVDEAGPRIYEGRDQFVTRLSVSMPYVAAAMRLAERGELALQPAWTRYFDYALKMYEKHIGACITTTGFREKELESSMEENGDGRARKRTQQA